MGSIEISIVNWERYQNRKDIKHPSWLRLENRIYASQSLFGLTSAEKWVWTCLLCVANQKGTGELSFVKDWFLEETRTTQKDLDSAVSKLVENGCVRVRTGTNGDVARQTDKQTDRHDKPDSANAPVFDLDLVYKNYPKKMGKKKGYEYLKKTIKTEEQFDLLQKAIGNYSDYCARCCVEPRFIKQFSSFANLWEDWIEMPDTASYTKELRVIKGDV